MAQRSAAIQNKYRKELREFQNQINDAKAEGDNMQGFSTFYIHV
jgi:hypothetical protein